MASDDKSGPLTTNARKNLFIEAAKQPGGTSTADVYRRARELGDTVTEEAYHNLARRLVHRGMLAKTTSTAGTKFEAPSQVEGQWLEEDDLAAMIDPDYPLLALTVAREATRQIGDVSEEVWTELRERLMAEPARSLFKKAITSYCDDFHAQVAHLVELETAPTEEVPRLRQEATASRRVLQRLTKFGLGLSDEAVSLPLSLDMAINEYKEAGGKNSYVDAALLEDELKSRVEDGPMIVPVADEGGKALIIGAVDGSTRGGMLSFLGESGDLTVGPSPMVAINTAVGRLNQSVRVGQRELPVFARLPEKPEDMQRQDNRYTVMAKLLYPDMSDAEYMHAIWNAMDLIEAKSALRLFRRWYGPNGVEIPPSDVVLRDGAVAPQERDFDHYTQLSSFGQIARDTIETNWEIARTCSDNEQTLAGVVKIAQLDVVAPVINWYACQLPLNGASQVLAWPLHSMNVVSDQVMMTRLLTAGRAKKDPWIRSCLVIRPFHAVSPYAQTYSRAKTPAALIQADYAAFEKTKEATESKKAFWRTFRPESDPYVKMLEHVRYGSFFLGALPRLDLGKSLPRLEFLVVGDTAEGAEEPWAKAGAHARRLLKALRQDRFDVSAEHSMFKSDAVLDVLPSLIIAAHDTAKLWASELMSRVQEYIGFYMARHVKTNKIAGVRVRPFTRAQLEMLYEQLRREREMQAGSMPQRTLEK